MSNELPEFASQWVQQWKQAAPRLQAIRDEELRRRGEKQTPGGNLKFDATGLRLYDRNPERHGMVILQQWRMRRQMLELAGKLTSTPPHPNA